MSNATKPKRRRVPTRAIIAVVVVLGVGLIWFLNRPDPVQVTVAIVERGTVEETVANTRAGTVKACRRARLSPLVGGKVEQLPIKEGSRVKQGDLLLALWDDDLTAHLHLAESEENPDRMEEAVRAYEKGWTVCMEQQLPVHLSVICRVNKSTARAVLAEMTNDAALADDVADEIEVILECFPHALQPLCAKHCEALMEKMRAKAKATSG